MPDRGEPPQGKTSHAAPSGRLYRTNDPSFRNWLNRIAVRRIRRALVQLGGDRNRVARMLGIDRVTLWRYLKWADEDNESRMEAVMFTVYADRNPSIDDAVELCEKGGLEWRPADAVMGRDAIEVFIKGLPDPILQQFKSAGYGVEERT